MQYRLSVKAKQAETYVILGRVFDISIGLMQLDCSVCAEI